MTEPQRLIAGRYRLDEQLASGGMGVVWRGWDERLERVVAVKQLRLQPGLSAPEAKAARDRAMREARNTARLHHAGAVPIYDVVEHDGQPCLIMQFLPSVSLQELLRRRGTLPAVDVARVGTELAAALTAAHRVGIVHRDVKPGNVLLAEDGSAKLTDFGISHALGDVSLTSTGMVTGTPAYLAPEVARGQSATFASDVYSLGSTLYTATEGHPPVESDNAMAVLHQVASGKLTPPRRSGPLTPLLLRMLDLDPSLRPDMDEAWRSLASLHRHMTAANPAFREPAPPTAVFARPDLLGPDHSQPAVPGPTVREPQGPGPQLSSPQLPPTGPAQSQPVVATPTLRVPGSTSRSWKAFPIVALLGVLAAVAVGLIYWLPSRGGGRSTTTSSATRPSTTSTNARTTSVRASSASATSSTEHSSSASRSASSASASSSASSSSKSSASSASSTSRSASSTKPTSSNPTRAPDQLVLVPSWSNWPAWSTISTR